jgi:hypothetical protein
LLFSHSVFTTRSAAQIPIAAKQQAVKRETQRYCSGTTAAKYSSMKISEITNPAPAITVPPVGAEVTSPPTGVAAQQPVEPTPDQMAQGEQLLGTIDPQVTPPEQAANKLTGWLKQYPWLDRVTDLLPATRVIKAAANAIDAIQAGDPKSAIAALAGAGGRAIQQANTLTNVGTNLAQGDVQAAALAAGGKIGQVARTADVTQNLAQNNLAGAAQAAGGTVAKAANVAQKAQQYAPQAQQAIQTALAPQQQPQAVSEEITRIRQLSGL